MRSHIENPDKPELLAVGELPSAAERRLREVNLARLMLIAVDLVLSGEGLRLETGRDLIREVEHTFPELTIRRDNLSARSKLAQMYFVFLRRVMRGDDKIVVAIG